MNKPRDLALLLLNKQSRKSSFSGVSLDEAFQDNPQLDARDRAFIRHLVQGVLRWKLRLDWIITQAADFPQKKIQPSVLNILRLALYQVFFMDKVPQSAAVNEAVKQARSSGPSQVVPFVNGILRNIFRQKGPIPFPDRNKDPVLFLSVTHSYPQWLVRKWISEYGREFTEGLLTAGNRIPTLTIRANRLKLDRAALIGRLKEEGVIGKPTRYSPGGVLLEGFGGKIDEMCAFREGLFQVQDQSAQITSHILAPRPGETIIDICAGLGGKTTHLAELMGDKGQILALDINEWRLIKLVDNSRRLGIGSVTPVVADTSRRLSTLFRRKFDRVMVDAPCSGLGVISRHPDGKWSRCAKDIERIARLQKALVSEAASILRRGGKMLYVTCTLSKEENQGVVEHSLSTHPDLALENIKDHVPEWGQGLVDNQGFLTIYPHIHQMDGFFGALFSRK